MKRILKWIGIGLVVALVVSQAIRPAKTNPPVDETKTIQANTQMSSEVSAILERACADCHSSKTTWPWYSQIAPVSWYVISDVNGGRKEMSLSDWGSYDARRKARKLQQICEQIEKGEMPMRSYVVMHPTAKLTDSDKQLLCDWAKQERERVFASQAENPH
jgi:cytochrome c551/c552